MTTVLVVDDEPDIVLFVQINLELAGFDVLTAGDGEQALDVVAELHPDALVLDVMMPKLDGWGVLERIKADPDEIISTIPVVMLTALTSDGDQVRGGIEGAVRYLSKPIGPELLIEAINDAISGDPEPVKRKAAQQQALARLARMERGDQGSGMPVGAPRPRLGRLERPRGGDAAHAAAIRRAAVDLTDGQRGLLRSLQATSSVSEAAEQLGMSRSNIYASLRRIGRKLDDPDVSDLLRRLRAGDLSYLLGD